MPVNDNQNSLDKARLASIATGTTGGGALALNQLLRSKIRRFSGTGSSDFLPELTEALDNYTNAYRLHGSAVDKMFNYASSGHGLTASKVFHGSDENAAHALDRLSGSVTKGVDNVLGLMKRLGMSDKAVHSLRRRLGGILPMSSLMAASHHSNFAISPLEAYMAMVHESKLNGSRFNIGKLTDDILEAHANFRNPLFTKGYSFKSPAEYFAWKHGDEFNIGRTIRPRLTEFLPSLDELSAADTRTKVSVLNDATRNYRLSMKDWLRSGGTDSIYEPLFNKTRGLGKDDILRMFGDGVSFREPNDIASMTIGDLFTRIHGGRNSYRMNADGTATLVKGNTRKFKTLGELMEHRGLLNDFIDPTVARRFRYSSLPYKQYGRFLKTMKALSSKGLRNAGAAGLAVGGAGYLASKLLGKNAEERVTKKADDNGEKSRARVLHDMLAASAGAGSAVGAGAYASKYRPKDFNPFAGVSATVIGGVKQYDPVARDAIEKTVEMASNALSAAKLGDTTKMEAALRLLEPVSSNLSAPEIEREQAGKIVEYFRRVLSGESADKPIETLLPDRVVRAFRQDSFSSQTQSAMDELRRRGVKIDRHILGANTAYTRGDLPPSGLLGSDAVIQVGAHPQENLIASNRSLRGAKNYRVLSDFGPGNFNQPDRWVGYNWMKVNDPSMYDRLIVPGGSYFDQAGKMNGFHGVKGNLNIDNIAVSPLFGVQQFADDAGSVIANPSARRARAMFTLGGGSAGLLGVHDPKIRSMYGDADRAVSESRIISEIEDALRSRHGSNFDLDIYAGNALSSPKGQRSEALVNLLTRIKNESDESRKALAAYEALPEVTRARIRNFTSLRNEFLNHVRHSDDIMSKGLYHDKSLSENIRRLGARYTNEDALLRRSLAGSDASMIFDKFLRDQPVFGRKYRTLDDMLDALRSRANIRIVEQVPQSELARAYANSDYVFMLPGSTSAEYLSLMDNIGKARGRLIPIVPQEFNGWTPSHFGTNAEYAKYILPDTRIVRADSATRAKDFIDAVSGERVPGRRMFNTASSWDDVARAIKRDVRLARLGRAGKLGLMAAPALAAAGYGAHRLLGGKGGSKPKIKIPSFREKKLDLPRWVAPAAAGTATALGTMALVNYLRRKGRDNDKPRGFNVSTY